MPVLINDAKNDKNDENNITHFSRFLEIFAYSAESITDNETVSTKTFTFRNLDDRIDFRI